MIQKVLNYVCLSYEMIRIIGKIFGYELRVNVQNGQIIRAIFSTENELSIKICLKSNVSPWLFYHVLEIDFFFYKCIFSNYMSLYKNIYIIVELTKISFIILLLVTVCCLNCLLLVLLLR